MDFLITNQRGHNLLYLISLTPSSFALAYAGVFYVRLLTVGRIEGSNTAFSRV